MISFVHSLKRLLGDRPDLPAVEADVFVIGSAPDPSVPTDLLKSATIFSVNGSQAALDQYGVSRPHFTFMRSNMSGQRDANTATLDALRGRQTETLVIVAASSKNTDVQFKQQRQSLSDIGYEFDNLYFLRKSHRYQIASGGRTKLQSMLVSRYGASMGICGIMSGLYMGADRVFFAGLSFRTAGHSYNSLALARRHVEEDAKVLKRARQRGDAILTCDSAFSEDSGIPLYCGQTHRII